MNNEDQDVKYNSAYNPFPEPQTIPSGWDLSEIISLSQVDSDTNDDAVESENP
jgi:hypothetical protein